MATIDLDREARLETADDAAADAPTGAEAWPSIDLAARRTAAKAPALDAPDDADDRPVEDTDVPVDASDYITLEPEDMLEPAPVVEDAFEPVAVEPDVAEAVAERPAVVEAAVEADPTDPATAAHDPRKPSTLLADLTTAMRATALAARDQALAQVERDATAAVDAVRATSVDTSKALRHHADEDVEGIREWTKAEIARIRSESEARIAGRRTELDEELATEAAAAEQHVFDVHDALARYQAEMAAFFERLVAETDAARLATMAETMPEPPSLSVPSARASVTAPRRTRSTRHDAPAAPREAAVESDTEGAVRDDLPLAVVMEMLEPEPMAEASGDAATAEVETAPADEPETPATEEEAAAAVAGEPAPREDGRSFAERLAGLLPHRGDDSADGEPQTTQVIVTGLASVASIASFKRQLSRVAGVNSVAVSSGPDGEFVFDAVHRPSARLAEAIPTLQGFGATIARTGEGVLFVEALDPDAES